jgi:antitoxin MazE
VRTKVQQWGNSLALRIPRSFAAEAKVEAGSVVDISVGRDGLHVRPLRRPRYELRELLNGVRPKNLHREVGTGRRVGREAL